MSWLLKIAEGPAKGAEVALMSDTRLKVGASADCDIVISDASLAPLAFELEVSESAVTLIMPDGTQTQMKPLEIRDFGTTAVAIGPADEPWGELVRPAPEPEAQLTPEEPSEESEEPTEKKEEERSHHGLLGSVLLVLVLLLLAALAWFFWPRLKTLVMREDRTTAGETCSERVLSLGELARTHGLKLGNEEGVAVLSGNLQRRTERLAIRALALAADPHCRILLTDDESLEKASNELLFAYTDGALFATAASNGTVRIAGNAPDAAALGRALRALNADVKGIERVDATGVTVGGQTPVRTEPTKVAFRGERIPDTKPVMEQPKSVQRDYPIAGILTAPYPCVVMRDGHRVMEGALIGTALLVRIECDRLVLKDGGTEFEWRP